MKTTSNLPESINFFTKRFRNLTAIVFLFISCTAFATNDIIPAVTTSSIISSPSTSTFNNVNHISCDGVYWREGNFNLKVFAWDGDDQGWAYDIGSGPQVLSFYEFQPVSHPEIALVSNHNGAVVYAIIAFEADYSGSHDALYEVWQWTGTTFNFVFNSVLAVGGSGGRVINSAGDEYGHYAIVWDDNGFNNGTTAMGYQTGYIDNVYNIIEQGFGTFEFDPGSGPQPLWQPDVDVTYYNEEKPEESAMVYVTFITTDGTEETVVAASSRIGWFYSSATWNSYYEQLDFITAYAVTNSLDHPSIAVNDGYYAYLTSSQTRVGVTFREYRPFDGFTGPYEDIYSFSAVGHFPAPRVSQNGNICGNAGCMPFSPNTYPMIVLQPQEIGSVVAWNYEDLYSSTPNFPQSGSISMGREGVAKGNFFDYSSGVPELVHQNHDAMQMNEMTPDLTTETAISGFDNDNLLYFYYTSDKELYYKTANYWSSTLRKRNSDDPTTTGIFPNPFSNTFQIQMDDKEKIYDISINDLTGRSLFNSVGNSITLNQKIETVSSSFYEGIYLITIKNQDGAIVYSDKLIKVN